MTHPPGVREWDEGDMHGGGVTHINDDVVRAITTFTNEVRYQDVNEASVHAAKRCLLDAVGCAIGAQGFRPLTALQSLAGSVSATRPARVIGTSIRTSPEMAAFVNGSAIRCLDFNDDYFGTEQSPAHGDTGPHPSDNIGGVLAAAQMAAADGASTLLGLMIAYEVCGHLVDEVVLRGNGWDHPTFHSIATAAASARMLGLPPAQVADAIRLAVVPNVCLYETRVGSISNWKGMAGPNGSRNGLFAALLAEAGITGPEKAFVGDRGFMRQLRHNFSLSAFPSPGVDFRVVNTYFKKRPLRYEMQLPVEMSFALRSEVDPADVATLRVYLERKSVALRANEAALWRPTSRETADHSGPYLIAAALLDGHVDEATFDVGRYSDPVVLNLIDTIELIEDPDYTQSFPWRMSCRFEVELKDGRRLTRYGENPKGHPLNPMSDDELAGKFRDQVEPRLGAPRTERLLGTIWAFDQERSLDSFLELTVPKIHA